MSMQRISQNQLSTQLRRLLQNASSALSNIAKLCLYTQLHDSMLQATILIISVASAIACYDHSVICKDPVYGQSHVHTNMYQGRCQMRSLTRCTSIYYTSRIFCACMQNLSATQDPHVTQLPANAPQLQDKPDKRRQR